MKNPLLGLMVAASAATFTPRAFPVEEDSDIEELFSLRPDAFDPHRIARALHTPTPVGAYKRHVVAKAGKDAVLSARSRKRAMQRASRRANRKGK